MLNTIQTTNIEDSIQNSNNFSVKKNTVSEYNMNNLGDHIIQHDIFSYLTSNDLFFQGRSVSTSWHEMVKNVWSQKIKEEMIDQVKSIDFIYEKEVFTKTYEFKLNYLINYKNLLSAYNNNANILMILNSLTQYLDDVEVKKLIIMFFSFCSLAFANDYVRENQIETLRNYLTSEENFIYYKIRILEMMVIEDNLYDINYLNNVKARFSELNKEYLENISEFAKLIYSFLQGMIEYQILKVEVKELKEKIENLLKRLQETSKIWPKKKRFLEKAYKLIIFNKNSTPEIRNIVSLYQKCKIRHPLIDYNDESIKSILELRNILLTTSKNDENNSELIDENIFNNITNRRILLTKKLIILEKFAELFMKCKTDDENIFIVNNQELKLRELLWCMKISSNSQEENVSEASILRTKEYLDKNFDFENHVLYTIPYRMRKDNLEQEININNEEKNFYNSLDSETEKVEFMRKISNIYKESSDCENKYCNNCISKQENNLPKRPAKVILNIEKTGDSDNDNNNLDHSDDETLNNLRENNFDIDKFYNNNRGKKPAYSNNLNENNSNLENETNYSNYNYIDPQLEEEVKDAEDGVRELAERKNNSENLISILENKEEEVLKLRKEKDILLQKKLKTEQVLDMLKKFIVLKDNMLKNKKYYRAILFLLGKIRSQEYSNDNTINLTQLINSDEIEEVMNNEEFQIELEFQNENYNDESNNFKDLDELIKEIEIGLLKQVNEIFYENSNENNLSD